MALTEIQQRLLEAVCNQPNPLKGKTTTQLIRELDLPETSRSWVTTLLFRLNGFGLIFNDWGCIEHRRCHLWFPAKKQALKSEPILFLGDRQNL